MDDYNWRLRLRSRKIKSHNRTATMLAIIMLALAVGSILWYFFIHARSPEYALDEIRDAVLSQDAEKFERYVNLDLATGKLYDDVTRDLFTEDTSLTPQTRAKATSFYQLIKPQVSAGIKTTLLSYAASGEWQLPGGLLRGRQLGIDFEYLMECSHLRDTSVLSIGDVTRDGSGAVAMLTVVDEGTGLEFPLQLRMEKGDLGWQVVRVVNYRAYLEAVQMAAGSDVTRYIEATRPIVDRYNGVFRSTQYEFLYLTETAWGTYTTEHRRALIRLLQDDVIPLLKKYQRELDAVEIPRGAAYLAAQRKASTEASIASYESFIRGLDTGLPEEFARAETLHKQALTYDLRVGDMVRRSAVSEETPATP